MNDKSGNFELLQPSSPDALIPDSWIEPWMVFAAGFVALIALLLLAIWIFKKKSQRAPDAQLTRNAAHAEAIAALKVITNIPTRDAAVRASLILRRYLSIAASDPALFETHEETLSRHEAFKDFSDSARAAAEQGFSHLAGLKYAASIPDLPTTEVIQESLKLLETLHHGFKA